MDDFEGAVPALEQEMSDLVTATRGLIAVTQEIRRTNGVSRAVAMEAERLMPGEFFSPERQVADFSAFPEFKHRSFALESLTNQLAETLSKIGRALVEMFKKFKAHVEKFFAERRAAKSEQQAEKLREPGFMLSLKDSVERSFKLLDNVQQTARRVTGVAAHFEPKNKANDTLENLLKIVLGNTERAVESDRRGMTSGSTSAAAYWIRLSMLQEEPPFAMEKVGRLCEDMIRHIHGYVQSLPDDAELTTEEAAAQYTQEFLKGQEALSRRHTEGLSLTEVVDKIKHAQHAAAAVDMQTYRKELIPGYQRLVTMTVNHRYEQYLHKLSKDLADLGMWNLHSKLCKAGSDTSNKLKLNIWRIMNREATAIVVLLDFFLAAYKAADQNRRMIATVLDTPAHIHHTLRRLEYQIRTVNGVDLDMNLAEIYAARKTWRE